MHKLQIFIRNIPLEKNVLYPVCCFKQTHLNKSTKSSSSSSDSDKEAKSKIFDRKKRSEESLNKLNSLLKKLVEEDVVRASSKLDLAKPTNKRIKKEAEEVSTTTDSVPKQMVNAVKDLAKTIGGDVKQTESELLQKLLSPIESSILTKNLSEVVKGMKIDRELKPEKESRSDQVRSLLQKARYKSAPREGAQTERKQRRPLELKQKPELAVQKIDLFGSEPLGIFTNNNLTDSPENKTWQSLYERDLKLAVTHPPANYFQQMILWTEQGKLWKFPINNEQDLEEESKVYFAKHVFLEEQLEPWCPSKGPVRHFMELVCVGLSKNPYLTVEAKREHIEWYKNYFEDKKQILQEVGLLSIENNPQKSIE